MFNSIQKTPEMAECGPPLMHSQSTVNHQHEAVRREDHLKDDQKAVGKVGDHRCQAHEVLT